MCIRDRNKDIYNLIRNARKLLKKLLPEDHSTIPDDLPDDIRKLEDIVRGDLTHESNDVVARFTRYLKEAHPGKPPATAS